MRILISLFFLLITTSSFAVTFDGKFIQGSFILGKTEPGSEVFIDKKKIKVTSDGFFAFGLSRDRKNDIVITINKKINITLFQFGFLHSRFYINKMKSYWGNYKYKTFN